MESRLVHSAFIWTILGLTSGLMYREFTRQTGYTGFTQLALAHTHALTLGTLVLLVVLILTRVFHLELDRRFRFFPNFWDGGLVLTFFMLTIKGTAQVLGLPWANSKALAGIAGLGHITLTATFILLFVVLLRAVKTGKPQSAIAE
ncbi:hypothetical protein JOD55_001186 [Arcanobacterium pluranimalium]|uniref:DUF2871 family protein n=1 Tax=Arcanobacterium pluranimalium TaxID=108028 RepID=UPI00195B97A1|nr:DUF2871 family protein [Arcanobacterium pluranimalium]MBM7825359.1 hypothetical protein [Arcanobacterium pluranimalium]